jgi:hypothetical protein
MIGVDPDGSHYDKTTAISETRFGAKGYISNDLNEVKVRFYGDAAVAQGSESWVRRTGSPQRGRFVWTDTWIRRNGQWQIVAAEDPIAPRDGKGRMRVERYYDRTSDLLKKLPLSFTLMKIAERQRGHGS